MKIIILLLLTFVTTISYSQQYSNYYLKSDVKANIDVNVSGTVYQQKTITTIDYGALQLANAQREKNRLEEIKFADDKQKRIALEIAQDPLKAYDFGSVINFELNKMDKDVRKNFENVTGFKNFIMSYVAPNSSIFTSLKDGGTIFQNVSKDGITTELLIYAPEHSKSKININEFEGMMEFSLDLIIIGKELEVEGKKSKIYYHKKELNRATVFGTKGYKSTKVWEDKFEYGIDDTFSSLNQNVGNGYFMTAIVRHYGDKDDITFEQLEGRRFYFKQLMEKIISTATVSNEKVAK